MTTRPTSSRWRRCRTSCDASGWGPAMAEAPHDHEDLAAAVAEAIAQLGEGTGAGSRIRKTAAGALSPRRGTVSLDDVEALHQDLADSERIVATLIRKAVE